VNFSTNSFDEAVDHLMGVVKIFQTWEEKIIGTNYTDADLDRWSGYLDQEITSYFTNSSFAYRHLKPRVCFRWASKNVMQITALNAEGWWLLLAAGLVKRSFIL
jgi:hypothetical protein